MINQEDQQTNNQEVVNTSLGDSDSMNNKTRKGIFLILLTASLIFAGFLAYFYLWQPKVSGPLLPKETKPVVVPALEAEVTINQEGFLPATILIKKGTQVTWVNNDSQSHQIASDPHPTHTNLAGFEADESLLTNDSFTFTFEEVGTFTYHDCLKPLDFKGTVIVE